MPGWLAEDTSFGVPEHRSDLRRHRDVTSVCLRKYPSLMGSMIMMTSWGSYLSIIYTLILVPMIKYVFIVLRANDQGDGKFYFTDNDMICFQQRQFTRIIFDLEGGTFALYSLICRYARVGLVPNQQAEDMMVSNYKLKMPSRNLERAEKIKEKLEGSNIGKILIFLTTILATSMVLGDGILTPCISGMS